MTTNVLLTAKQQLRLQVATSLSKLTVVESAKQSKSVLSKLIGLDQYKKAKAICVYLSMGSNEVDTAPILQDAFKAGKRCFVPRVEDKTTMNMYEAFDLKDIAAFPKTKWQIPEPPKDGKRQEALECEDLGIIVMPGVAFDSERRRLGHGRGYYDYYLARLKEARDMKGLPMPALVAVALAPQIVKQVPVGPGDKAVDLVLAPDPE